MFVFELIEKLNEFDPNLLVILQKDPEGNGYLGASGADLVYGHDTGWEVEDVRNAEDCGETCNEDEWDDCSCEDLELFVVVYP